MNKVLSKRIPREFKSNLPKYIALLLLIVLCMYLVTAMVASSETIISEQTSITPQITLRTVSSQRSCL